MKPLFQELPFPIDSHIHFYVEDLPHFIVPWHYHPAIEIMYITSGTGTRFVGDHVEGYFEGDVCMIGPQLAHEWRNDPVPACGLLVFACSSSVRFLNLI